ncbi:MAG: hypothetical protein OEW93_05590 [Candidatus Bathyarchaeota archaeon]|nr:hypothetical protein [Candidatus Bathyarchaeota archaeon]
MSRRELDPVLCEGCGRPLFLDKEECRGFIEERLRKGFIVCSCCGAERKEK